MDDDVQAFIGQVVFTGAAAAQSSGSSSSSHASEQAAAPQEPARERKDADDGPRKKKRKRTPKATAGGPAPDGPGVRKDGKGALPVACSLSRAELLERMRNDVPPADADEYLARVRLEAREMPKVSRVDAETLKQIKASEGKLGPARPLMQAKPMLKPQAGTTPSGKWRKDVVFAFMQLRQFVLRWEDRAALGAALQGPEPSLPEKGERQKWQALCASQDPTVKFVMEVDQQLAGRLIKDFALLDAPMDARLASWMYALLARIEKPLGVGMEAHMRALLRSAYLHRSPDNYMSADVLICVLEDSFNV